MNLQQLVDAMDAQVCKGDILGAFEKFAADNCSTLSSAADKTNNKAQKMEALRWFMSNIAATKRIERIAVKQLNDIVTDSQFSFEFLNHFGETLRYEEVIRRTWANGLVVEEIYLVGNTIEQEPSASAAASKKATKVSAPKADKKTADKPSKTTSPKATAKTNEVKSVKDDLTLIEGIGPKIAELLNAAGIVTFADLAKAKPAAIKTTLEAAGKRYQMHDPATWPKQATLARDGKMTELKKLQAELKGGK